MRPSRQYITKHPHILGWLLWLCVWSCSALASSEDFHARFESVKSRAGVTLSAIDAIFQDSIGFIWMGGENGLVRYDGYSFRVYRNQPDNPASLSDNTIWTITEDANGDLWIATEGGVNRFNRQADNFTRFIHDPKNPHSLPHDTVRSVKITRSGALLVGTFGGGASMLDPATGRFTALPHSLTHPHIWSVFEDKDGKIWLGTEGGGATRYDPLDQSLTHYHTQADATLRIASNTVRAISQGREGEIWLGTDAGVHRVDDGLVSRSWSYNPGQPDSLGSNIVWDVLEDRNGDIWVATDGGGLNLIRDDRLEVRRFIHNSLDPTSISSDVVRRVMEDQSGDIWTANFPSGVNIFHRAAQWVAYVHHDPEHRSGLNHPSALAFLETEDGSLWVGTDGGGINRIHPDGRYEYLRKATDEPSSSPSLSADAILALAQDHEGDIWIGTWGGGVNRYNPKTGKVRQYLAQAGEEGAISHPNVWAVLVDKDGDVWFGTEGGGLNRYDRQNDRFERIPYDKKDPRHTIGSIIWSLFEDQRGMIWIGTNSGLSRLNKHTGEFRHWQNQEGNPLSLSNNVVLTIFEDSDQQIWIGTRAGLNRLHPNGTTFQVIRTEDGLASDNITSILQDRQGLLWLGTSDGLASLDPSTYTVRNYNGTEWARGKFNYGAALKLRDGDLVFGSIQGFIRFAPEQLQQNTFKPPVVLTEFQVFNKNQEPGAEDSALKESLTTTRHIVLNHRQAVFSFEFAALNYYVPEGNRYAYKLEGFDRSWNDIGHARRATYTNLSPGEYFFRVKAANNDGVWNEDGLEVRITITPPFWRTWWAYLIYTAVLGLLVWSFIQAQHRKVVREREVNERLRQLDKMKDDFLANTSHALRTPLTGIIGLADTLLEGVAGELNPHMRLNLEMISASGKRLSNLVNDILDFARLKNRKLQVQLQPVELRALVDSVLVLSRPLVGKKDLDLSNHVDATLPLVLADENRLQQVLYNLVGNAIKFTDHGSIVVTAHHDGEWIWVSVSDTGKGIPEANLEKIFSFFDEQHHRTGSGGLGLAVTRQLVELQGGEIRVTSEPGRGSTFYFSLRSAGEARPPVPAVRETVAQTTPQVVITDGKLTIVDTEEVRENRQFRLLVVDDESANRQILRDYLVPLGYQLEEADSGTQALELLHKGGFFDLVLLDSLMPGMSGYEVCAAIREVYPLKELPVILMTSKHLIADLKDGFEVGANDFLTKPIAKGELLSRVRTHLQLLDSHRHFEEKVRERTQAVIHANRVLETLDGIVATINQEVISSRLLDVLLREASRLFPAAERAIYWSLDEATLEFQAIAGHGLPYAQLQNLRVNAHTLITRYCEQGEKLDADIYRLKPTAQSAAYAALVSLLPTRSEIALAIRFEDGVVGFLCLLNLSAQDAFDHVDLDTLNRFHTHTRAALLKAHLMEHLKAQNERLEDTSLIDPLTGLHNRRYVTTYLDSDIALTLRSHRGRAGGEPPPPNSDLLFFMLSIGDLQQIDERYGRGSSDKVLVQTKRVMARVFRSSDFLARWSANEFLVVARFSNRKAAPLMAERLLQAIRQHAFEVDETEIHCNCAIGFASFPFLLTDPLAFSWNQVVDIASMCVQTAKSTQPDSWVGLEANSASEGQLTYQAIATRPQQLIKEHRLLLHSSLDPEHTLSW